MSPEQARGQAADRRADVWSFGVVLFEMLSGRQLFGGETVSDSLASVLKTEIDWSELPAGLPPRVRTLLARCLDRDRNRRLRDIGEARIMLGDELRGAADTHIAAALRSGAFPATATPVPARSGARSGLMVAGALLMGAVLALGAGRLFGPPAPGGAPLRKLAIGVGKESERVTTPVIAPDGHAIAYLTPTHIVVRELGALETRRFPIHEGVEDLFWSPDGRSLAYIVRSRMYRVDAQSGQQQVVCEARGSFAQGSGGSWGPDGTILFTQADQRGFFEVSERGGDPRQVLPADSTREGDFHDPFLLPGKRGVLFVPHRIQDAFATIELWAKGERKVLVNLEGQTLASPVYSPTGHILFRRSPTNSGIWAVPFSLDRLEATGEAFLAGPAGTAPSVSSDGTLVYQEGSVATALRLTWNDSEGREVADAGALAFQLGYTFPALAPDGQRATASIHDDENPDLWVFDISRGTRTRLTFGAGREEFPVWTPAGDAVIYHVRPEGSSALSTLRLVRVAADGTGRPDTLGIGAIPTVSPDGRYAAYSKVLGPGEWDLAYRPLEGDRSQEGVLVRATGTQVDPRVAPGGAYVAYASDESGRGEVYLTRFPSGEGRWQVSVGGGMWPRWSRRGDRVFYAKDNDIMAVDVTLGTSPALGTPRLVFTRPALSVPTLVSWPPGFDVTGDGERFLYFRDLLTGVTEQDVIVVQNWYSEFGARK
jgi:serine/threonine-protein kinase